MRWLLRDFHLPNAFTKRDKSEKAKQHKKQPAARRACRWQSCRKPRRKNVTSAVEERVGRDVSVFSIEFIANKPSIAFNKPAINPQQAFNKPLISSKMREIKKNSNIERPCNFVSRVSALVCVWVLYEQHRDRQRQTGTAVCHKEFQLATNVSPEPIAWWRKWRHHWARGRCIPCPGAEDAPRIPRCTKWCGLLRSCTQFVFRVVCSLPWE